MSGFRIYLWAECAKLRRCRMLAVFVFGALLVVLLVLVQGGLNGSGVSYLAEPYWVLTGVQSLGSIFALPALVALLGGYLFCRERQENVWKSLLVLPADTRWMTLAKLALTLAGSAGLYLLLFLAALCMEAVLHGGGAGSGRPAQLSADVCDRRGACLLRCAAGCGLGGAARARVLACRGFDRSILGAGAADQRGRAARLPAPAGGRLYDGRILPRQPGAPAG